MALEPIDYSLMFPSKNVQIYLETRRWNDEGSRDFHVWLLQERLESALQGASYLGMNVHGMDFADLEHLENYRILVSALPELGKMDTSGLRDKIASYLMSLGKILGDRPLDDTEKQGLLELCKNLSSERLQTMAA